MVAAGFPSALARPQRSLSRTQWALAAGVVVAAHVAAAWGLLQMRQVRESAARHAPLFVDWIAPPPKTAPAPPKPRPTEPPKPAPRKAAPLPPAPPLVAAAPTPAPAPPAFVAPPPPIEPPAPAPAVAEAPPAPTAPAAPPPQPPAPPQPRTIPATAVQYVLAPAPEYPVLSSRLRETGTVVVHVLIGEDGTAKDVRVHKSSGHPRLDAAAVAAVRKARFRPYTENGQAVAVWAPAPIEFELEK